MVKSTNQVTQFFVVEKTAVLKKIKDPSGAVITGYQVVVDDRDTTDVIPAKQVLGVNKVLATADSEKLYRQKRFKCTLFGSRGGKRYFFFFIPFFYYRYSIHFINDQGWNRCNEY